MIETVTTMVSMLLSAGAGAVIVATMWEDRDALRRALAGTPSSTVPPLPPHTHRVAGPRRARFITLDASTSPLRAAA